MHKAPFSQNLAHTYPLLSTMQRRQEVLGWTEPGLYVPAIVNTAATARSTRMDRTWPIRTRYCEHCSYGKKY
ncbi:hypothetical protein DPMN_194698 [Dreissena polymorpha]|uniref:Uncharacterized protein n=1 Tax=Dreissena polymorpha TaxID=45954 RepID=A0A9D4BBX7_DREPO|nr:hypothetical protein DPMN_194698 [Dreissena polymorpha]